jgi:hypothetical protein
MGESHDVRVMKGINTEDVMQARRSVHDALGGGIHGTYKLMNRMHGSKYMHAFGLNM